MSDVRELRLRYTVDGMMEVIRLLDGLKLGPMAGPLAMFLVHASNAANWHEVDEGDQGSA